MGKCGSGFIGSRSCPYQKLFSVRVSGPRWCHHRVYKCLQLVYVCSFSVCGYNNAITFKTITEDDIKHVESFVANELIQHFSIAQTKFDEKDKIHFYGPAFQFSPTNFKFNRGETTLIKEIINYVKDTVAMEERGVHYFNQAKKNISSNIQTTSVGQVFIATDTPKLNDLVSDSNNAGEESTSSTSTNTRTHMNLNLLLRTANDNSERTMQRYRFPNEIKSFCSYFRLLRGPLSYNVLQNNLNLALPSLPSVNRYLQQRNGSVTEGVLRCSELLFYLEERKLPKIISLSEDATRIVGRIQYDHRNNQLMGFVLPINEDGIPIPFAYQARNAIEIYSHFKSGNNKGNNVASFFDVIQWEIHHHFAY